MSDLISRSALLRKTETMHDGMKYCLAVNEKHIYTAPAVDAVPVVKCKDCCHAEVVRNKGVVMYIGCGYFQNTILSKDFYCANGEAKMDGGDADV